MNAERELELQAYVDGELSGWRASRVSRQIEADAEAQQVVAELKTTKSFLAGNELEQPLKEDPQFYWNRIRQAIERAEAQGEKAAEMPVVAWRRILAPLAGAAMAVLLAILGFNWASNRTLDDPFVHVAEVENLSEDTDSFSFRSASENMFVVWVHEKAPTTAPDAELTDDFFDDEDL